MRLSKLQQKEPGVIRIDFSPTSPLCPIAFKFTVDIKNAELKVDGVDRTLVYCQGHIMKKR